MKKIIYYCLSLLVLTACSDNNEPVVQLIEPKEEQTFNTTFAFIREYRVYPLFDYDFGIRIYYDKGKSDINNIMSNWEKGWSPEGKDTLKVKALNNKIGYKYQIILLAKEGQDRENYHTKLFASDTLVFNNLTDTLISVKYPSDTLNLLRRIIPY